MIKMIALECEKCEIGWEIESNEFSESDEQGLCRVCFEYETEQEAESAYGE